jgi:hypothetical protein
MRFLLGTVLTLLVVIDYVVAVCSISPTQINVSMCSWSNLRGKHSLSISFQVSFFFFFSFFNLTLIANILRDTIFLDGGELSYQMYEVPHGQYPFSLTIAGDMMTVASSTKQMTVCATNRCCYMHVAN